MQAYALSSKILKTLEHGYNEMNEAEKAYVARKCADCVFSWYKTNGDRDPGQWTEEDLLRRQVRFKCFYPVADDDVIEAMKYLAPQTLSPFPYKEINLHTIAQCKLGSYWNRVT